VSEFSIAGIDYSIGGPAICIHPHQEEWDFSKCRFTYLTGTICRQKNYEAGGMIFSGQSFIKNYDYDVERFMYNALAFMKEIYTHCVTDVKLEGYAMAGKGKVFNLAEATGILKRYIVINNINMTADTPPVIKKFATDKGNAGKPLMVDTFQKETGIDLLDLFELNGYSSPADDIVDSYYICKLLHNNLYK